MIGHMDLYICSISITFANWCGKVKFDNEVIHRSKVIKHFLDNTAAQAAAKVKTQLVVYK